MRRLITIAACALASVALPTAATADAIHTVESWSNEPTDLLFQGDFCTGYAVAGYGIESGTARITETANGGFHVTGRAEGSVPLYRANGPGPWDPQLGEYVATWTYSARFDEQVAPSGHGSFGGVTGGRLVYADGTSQYRQIVFRLVLQPDGPPKLFLVRLVCGGLTG